MAVECGSCKRAVLPNNEGRLSPWCPFCGADMKAKTVAAPALGAAAEPPAPPVALRRGPEREALQQHPRQPASEDAPRLPAVDTAGPPEQVYRGSGWRRLVAWLVSFACFGLAGAIVYGVMHQPGKNPQSGMLLAGFFALGGLPALYVALTLGELSYLVFRDRLVEKRGRDERSLRWDQILEIYEMIHPAWRSYRLITGKGFNIELTGDIKNHVALGDTIEQRQIETLLPAALAELEHGGTLRFGPLGVSKEALHFDMLSEGWNRLTMSVGLDMEQVHNPTYSQLMCLHIYSQAQTRAYKVEVGKIPNFALFLELARRIWPGCVPAGW